MNSLRNNFKFAFTGQFIVIAASIGRTLLLPLILTLVSFGYWQTYLLYVSFLGLLSFGYNDGILLLYSKYDYKDLPKRHLRSSLFVFFVISLLLPIIIALILYFSKIIFNPLYYFVLINIPIVLTLGVFLSLLQTTNNIKKYSFYSAIDKVLLMIAVLLFWVFSITNYYYLILTDIAFKIVMLFSLFYYFKELIFGKLDSLNKCISSFLHNINVGYKLLFANFSGMIILGVGRFLVQGFLSIETFAKYSFGLVIINFLMISITSISTVVFPHYARKNISESRLNYVKINNIIVLFSPLVFLSYHPLYLLVFNFYPEYITIFNYFIYFLCFVPVTAKMSILNNTFYKTLRLEKIMLRENVISVIVFIFSSVCLIKFYTSISVIAISTLLSLTYRCYASQIYISNKLGIVTSYTKIIEEIILLISMIFIFNFFEVKLSFILLILILMVWFFYKKNEFINFIKMLPFK